MGACVNKGVFINDAIAETGYDYFLQIVISCV
ncbi:MAG: hypothetical protein JWR72_2173 [Flavisolibacter sp.]|jgi:hypothetical protein|nr:hypothetical protein [Flavisolibacter sp.]